MSPEVARQDQASRKRKRSREEIILLMLSALSIPSILPFGIFRLIQQNWVSATIDLMIVFGMTCMMIYVWITGKVRTVSMLITIFYSVGMLAAIHVRGVELVYWTYPTMIAAFFMLRPSLALAINAVSLSVLIVILYQHTPVATLLTVCVTIVLVNLFSYIFSYRTGIQQRELHLETERDFLTGVGNRRALDRSLAQCFEKDDREIASSLLMLDIDHFKHVNDLFGHAVGDDVLVRICELIHTRTRASDSIFRYGGEEFVVIVNGASEVSANRIAESLRVLIAETVIIADYPITVSIGVAGILASDDSDSWLQRADRMLYLAKQSGRNAVRVAGQESG